MGGGYEKRRSEEFEWGIEGEEEEGEKGERIEEEGKVQFQSAGKRRGAGEREGLR